MQKESSGKLAAPAARTAKLIDRIARWVITGGGLLVVVCVIFILLVILWEVIPLFRPPKIATTAEFDPRLNGASELIAVNVSRVELGADFGGDAITGYTLARDGTFTFLDFSPSTATSPHAAGQTLDHDGSTDAQTISARVIGVRRVIPLEKATGKTIVAVRQAAGRSEGAGSDSERIGGTLPSKQGPASAQTDGQTDPATRSAVQKGDPGTLYTLVWSDGSIMAVEPVVSASFDEFAGRKTTYDLAVRFSVPPQPGTKPLQAQVRISESGVACVVLTEDRKLELWREVVTKDLFGNEQRETVRVRLETALPAAINTFTLDAAGKQVFAGTTDGYLMRWKLNDSGKVVFNETLPAFGDRRAITAMSTLLGDSSLAVCDSKGEVTVWFEVEEGAQRVFRLIHRVAQHAGPVRYVVASQRNKGLVSLGEDGVAHYGYSTSARTVCSFQADSPLEAVGFAARANALIGLRKDGRLIVWRVDAPHPEVTFQTLFAKVHYEGYSEPVYKWLTAGEEPKYSLVPIVFGTLKATVYALAFALPLSLFGALYVSHFTTPAFRNFVKPVIEIMAAVPSVVVGFLMLLWLGPLMSRWIVAFMASLATIPVTFVAFMLLWQLLRRVNWLKWAERGYEFAILAPVIVIGGAVAYWISPWVENLLFQGDFKHWLFEITGKPYEATNSIVVAIGLGFAIIPIILSISEDALSSVPYNLTAASLALGASRWQTVWRVVLPSASPGVFAASMMGFGRAAGETMIVFMATGNTPIIDWSPFNGFRTLASNIAMEIGEAPHGESLYRILFLCAVILFLMTLVANTAAELVRQRLRKKFGKYQ